MPLEVEVKLKIDSHESVRERLKVLEAKYLGRVLETNHIFDTSDRTLQAADKGLRVRVCRTDTGQIERATLTVKGPRIDSAFKSRHEIDTTVGDPEAMLAMLDELGFVEAVRFEKWRESWQQDACRIELDELPHLGRYVEIEGPDEVAIHEMQRLVGLANLSHEPKGYVALLVDYCRGHDLPSVPIRF